jgi:hypothetical protein
MAQPTPNDMILAAMMSAKGKISGDLVILQPTTYKLSASDFSPARPVGKDVQRAADLEDERRVEEAMTGRTSSSAAGGGSPEKSPKSEAGTGRRRSVSFVPPGGAAVEEAAAKASKKVFSPDSDDVFFSPEADLQADRKFAAEEKALVSLKKQLLLLRLVIREKNDIIASMEAELHSLYRQMGLPNENDGESGDVRTKAQEARSGGGGKAGDNESAYTLRPPHRRSMTDSGLPPSLCSPMGRSSVGSFSPSLASPSHHRRSSSAASFSKAATSGVDLGHALELAQKELVRKEEEAAKRDLKEKALEQENKALKEKFEETLLMAEALAKEVASLRRK